MGLNIIYSLSQTRDVSNRTLANYYNSNVEGKCFKIKTERVVEAHWW